MIYLALRKLEKIYKYTQFLIITIFIKLRFNFTSLQKLREFLAKDLCFI